MDLAAPVLSACSLWRRPEKIGAHDAEATMRPMLLVPMDPGCHAASEQQCLGLLAH